MKIQKLVPFLVIFILVVYMAQRSRNVPLSAPAVEVLPLEQRSSEGIDFLSAELTGQTFDMEDFRGKVLLLNFFETWCPPCREEMPTLEALFQRYKDQGLIVVGIAGDKQGKKIVEPFVEDFGMSFPVLLDSNHRVTNQYHVRGIPAIFLVDKQGRLAGSLVGGADWSSDTAHAIIERLLQESPSS